MPLAHALHQRKRGKERRVLVGNMTHHRSIGASHPRVDFLGQPARHCRCRMHVHVDQSRHDQTASRVDGLHRLVRRFCDLVLGSNRNDLTSLDGNRAMLDESDTLSPSS